MAAAGARFVKSPFRTADSGSAHGDSNLSNAPVNRSPMHRNFKSGSSTPLRKPVAPAEDDGPTLPRFGDWNVADPSSADEFSAIFDKKIHEKREGGSFQQKEPTSPNKNAPKHPVKRFCCFFSTRAEG